MPIYRCKVRGENKPRIVRADTAAQARNHIVEAETMTAEEMADAIECATGVRWPRMRKAAP